MNNKRLKNRKNVRGTALLIALLVMGVFIAVSIALFGLLFREVKSTKNHISAGKAYYAAESGVEEALYYLNSKLPGWEGDEDLNKGELKGGDKFYYEVDNRCGTYPCFEEDEYDISSILSISPEKLYDELELSENNIIPMFVVEKDGKVKSIKNFVVQFFAGFNPDTDLNVLNGQTISGWDVLRWKVFGMKKDGDNYVTDSIDDFTAVSAMYNKVSGDNYTSTAKEPSWFGSYNCSKDISISAKDADSKDGIKCNEYWSVASESGHVWGDDQQQCTNLQARDYYVYDGGKVTSISGCYPVLDFMEDHMPPSVSITTPENSATGLNYISLTNLMNPAMFNEDVGGNYQGKRDISKIFFRLEAFDDPDDESDTDQFVRDTAEIISRGFSGDSKQSIEVHLKRGTYMPVFNFAIYSTTGSETGEYYQDQELPE